MRHFVLISLVLAAVAAPAVRCDVPPSDQVLLWYMGNCDPTTPNSCGPGLKWILRSYATNLGSLVIDNASSDPAYNASDGLAWRVVDEDDGLRAVWRTGPEHKMDHIWGHTVVARVKTVSSTPYTDGTVCGNIGMYDANTGNNCMVHWGGANNYLEETVRGVSANPVGDDKYHIIRMTAKGRTYGVQSPWGDDFEAYTVDQPLTGQGAWEGNAAGGPNPTPPPAYVSGLTVVTDPDNSANKALMFVGGDAIFRDFTYVLGRPKAGTNKMVFTCKIKSVMTSGNCWFIHVNDINGTNIAQWYGAANTARPRIAGTTTVGTPRTLSGGGVWDTLKIEIDATPDAQGKKYAYFSVDLGSDGTWDTPDQLDYTLGDPNRVDDMIGQIAVESPWDYQGNNTVYFDDFSLDADPVTEMLREIKVYLDENPTPVLTMVPAYPSNAQLESWVFGTESNQGYGRQEIYFDWITGSNRGAFAPGEEVAVLGQSLVPPAQTPLATIEAIKAASDRASVIIPEAVVVAPYMDQNFQPLFFAIEKQDRSSGIRVLSSDAVAEGAKVKIWGSANTTNDGERVLVGSAEVLDYGPFDTPKPLAMNNKASGGGVLGGQRAVKEYSTWLTFDPFAYPDGALLGNDGWTVGNADASHVGVSGQEVRVYWNIGTQNAGRAVGAVGSPYSLTFKAKQGSPGASGAGFMWRVYVYDAAGTELASWYGTWTTIRSRLGGSVGTTYNLTPGGNECKIVLDQAAGKVKFYFDGVQDSFTPNYAGQAPARIDITNINRTTVDLGNYVILDDFALDNMAWIGGPDKDAIGLSNVGLLVRLYGKVTASWYDPDPDKASFDTSYFYIDDGSGILGPYPHKGVRCTARYTGHPMDVPAVDDYVWVEGVLGMRGGERCLYTYRGSW